MIVARDLWASPPGVPPVVRGVSLSVADGEWLAVTGPNGSGKSTLALTLAGLIAPTRGTVEVDGLPLIADPESRRSAGIAVVMQEPAAQLLQTSVAEEVAFTARNLGLPEAEIGARVADTLARLDLVADADRDPRRLSAGRQQLVLLAAALATRPRVLVVDEGGAHWDGTTRALALGVVREYAALGMAVVWVTQEADERDAASRVLALEGCGRVIENGSGDEGATVVPLPGLGLGGRVGSRPAVRLEVAAWDGRPGRAVRTSKPMVIDCAPGLPTAVLGANGSGKTVLLEAAVGLEPSAQVRVVWSEPHLPPIMAGQHAELEVFADHVGDELMFAARSRGATADEARQLASTAILAMGWSPESLSARVWDLSAGERRLIQVLAATLAPAGLIALDEPTCGLDPERRGDLARWVSRAAAQTPVLVASQDLAWVSRLGASRAVIGRYPP